MPAWRHLLLAAPLLTADCGGAPLPEATRAPATQAVPADPTTIEEAQARIRAAADTLGIGPAKAATTMPALPSASAQGSTSPEAPAPAPPPPPPAPPRAPVSGAGAPPGGQEAKGPAGKRSASEESDAVVDRCPTACRALGSMERAVSALCRLTGEGDERCRDARRTLFESAARTASCGCPR